MDIVDYIMIMLMIIGSYVLIEIANTAMNGLY